LRSVGQAEPWAARLTEPLPVEQQDLAQSYGEALPVGLLLRN
jgi:hypothetical protein